MDRVSQANIENNGGTVMDNQEIIEMLKEMQIKTAKCNGFFVGHVTQGWVIRDLLGKKIKELGGKPYVIKDNKLIVEDETETKSNNEVMKTSIKRGGR